MLVWPKQQVRTYWMRAKLNPPLDKGIVFGVGQIAILKLGCDFEQSVPKFWHRERTARLVWVTPDVPRRLPRSLHAWISLHIDRCPGQSVGKPHQTNSTDWALHPNQVRRPPWDPIGGDRELCNGSKGRIGRANIRGAN